MNTLTSPTTLLCGHNFDILCISQWLQMAPSCPLCAANVAQAPSSLRINVALRDMLQAMADTAGNAGSLSSAAPAAASFSASAAASSASAN